MRKISSLGDGVERKNLFLFISPRNVSNSGSSSIRFNGQVNISLVRPGQATWTGSWNIKQYINMRHNSILVTMTFLRTWDTDSSSLPSLLYRDEPTSPVYMPLKFAEWSYWMNWDIVTSSFHHSNIYWHHTWPPLRPTIIHYSQWKVISEKTEWPDASEQSTVG